MSTTFISVDNKDFVAMTTKSGPVHPQGGSLKLVRHEKSVAIGFDTSEGPVVYVHDVQDFLDAVQDLADMIDSPPPEPEPEPEPQPEPVASIPEPEPQVLTPPSKSPWWKFWK